MITLTVALLSLSLFYVFLIIMVKLAKNKQKKQQWISYRNLLEHKKKKIIKKIKKIWHR